jgi:hypothetical protein
MDGDDEGEEGAEEDDEGQATPRAGNGGFQSASSATEGLSRPGPVRRLRPADSLGGHRSRLDAGRSAHSRSGERASGLLPREDGLAPDPKNRNNRLMAWCSPRRSSPSSAVSISSSPNWLRLWAILPSLLSRALRPKSVAPLCGPPLARLFDLVARHAQKRMAC